MNLDLTNIPSHVAIIMDGNGRWAKTKGKNRIFGHRNGAKAVQKIVKEAARLGIKNLTLYAFSTENWKRPKIEVNTLMSLLINALKKELSQMIENNMYDELLNACTDALAHAAHGSGIGGPKSRRGRRGVVAGDEV